jgi:hypothetical protein
MIKKLFAALLATTIASPALSQSQERVGQVLALMKIAPAMCGTSSEEVAKVTTVFILIAELKHWRLEDLAAIRDTFRAKDEFSLRDPKLCETVAVLVKATSTIDTIVESPVLDDESEEYAPPASPEPATVQADASDDVTARIKTFCLREWPDDYVMQEYCIDKQTEARRKVEQF